MDYITPLKALQVRIVNVASLVNMARENTWGATEYAKLYDDVDRFYDELTVLHKMLGALKQKLAYEDVPAAFERDGVKTLNMDGGYRMTISPRIFASCKEMDKGIAWLKEHGQGDLVKETVNGQSLSAWAREELKENRNVPDDVFTVFIGKNTSITHLKRGETT